MNKNLTIYPRDNAANHIILTLPYHLGHLNLPKPSV